MTAGMGRGDESEDEDFTDDLGRGRRRMMDETSPSVVRRAEDFEDESF